MIIKPIDKNIIRIIDEDVMWTVVQSYKNYDGIDSVFTLIKEDAYASPLVVIPNINKEKIKEYFNVDLIPLFKD